jgi:23S rRNA (cytidine1920-2'-O)/16S rRNA (cytidine1409-2'-O)-methyltransferase
MAKRIRLDILLTERGLAESREKAQRLIRAGQVFIGGQRIDKPGAAVAPDAELTVVALGPRFVSRGGKKLQSALERFNLSPAGKVCLDLGASTGGFTDCLLQAGAARVYAIDVGKSQLHEKLRGDPRVISREGLNARYLDREAIGEPIEFCTGDLSFISLLKVIPAVGPLMAPGAALAVLVKPQFEAGREHVRKGGVVTGPDIHRETLLRVLRGISSDGFDFRAAAPSPLRGPAGNREYLAWFVRSAERPGACPDEESAARAVAEAFAEDSP